MSTANDIGGRLREARQASGLSLRKVAKELGVSASLISQVETGKTQPSVATLYGFATLLAISVDDLLGLQTDRKLASALDPHLDLQRAGENPSIEMENGVRWERLAMGRDNAADALLVTYQPGASSSLEGKLTQHTGSEYAYVLEGEITLQLEFDSYVLKQGDSIHFESTRPHMFANHGDARAVGVWFVLGRREQIPVTADMTASGQRSVRSVVEVLARLDALD